MSKVRERLEQLKRDLENHTIYKEGLPGSAVDIVNALLEDLAADEKENGWSLRDHQNQAKDIWYQLSGKMMDIQKNLYTMQYTEVMDYGIHTNTDQCPIELSPGVRFQSHTRR